MCINNTTGSQLFDIFADMPSNQLPNLGLKSQSSTFKIIAHEKVSYYF